MAKADTKPTNASPLRNPKVIIAVVIGVLFFVATTSLISGQNKLLRERQTASPTPTPTSRPLPTNIPTPSPTSDIIEIDTRDPDWQQQLEKVMPKTTPSPTAKEKPPTVDPNEKTHCYVEKNGSFEMTVKECQDLHDANPFSFQVKAYTNCLDGKNYAIGDSGSPESRKQKCSDLIGIVEK